MSRPKHGHCESPEAPVNNHPLIPTVHAELQALRRMAMGHTNREIASAYKINIKTVDTYRSRLLKKLKPSNDTELSGFAIQNKLIQTFRKKA